MELIYQVITKHLIVLKKYYLYRAGKNNYLPNTAVSTGNTNSCVPPSDTNPSQKMDSAATSSRFHLPPSTITKNCNSHYWNFTSPNFLFQLQIHNNYLVINILNFENTKVYFNYALTNVCFIYCSCF